MRKPKLERPEEQQRFETFLRSRQLKALPKADI